MSAGTKAVFLSYASQDSEAARKICEALRAAGIEVWFDQSELRGGDAWDQKIRKQIKECALFVPIISTNTQARLEGYFRLEWRLADQRSHLMARGKAFLLPVVVDDTRDAEAHVPDSFLEVQWTRSRQGAAAGAFAERVKSLLVAGGASAATPVPQPHVQAGRGAAARRVLPPSRVLLFGAVATGVILAGWWGFSRFGPGGTKAVAANVSEARQLVERARSIYERGDQINRETYALTEELLLKAEQLDVTDAEAWALHATISTALVNFGFDRSPARREQARSQAERALKLAPESESAQLAYAGMRIELAGVDTLGAGHDTAEGERIVRRILARQPDNWVALRLLTVTLNRAGRRPEAIELLQRAPASVREQPAVVGDLLTSLTGERRFAEAEQLVASSLARQPSGRVLEFDVKLKLISRGDPAAAAAALDHWPAWMYNEDRGAQTAAEAWMFDRQPAKALAVLARFSRDYIRHARFFGPRAALTAWLHDQAGNLQAARSDWRTTIEVADRELAATPGNAPALHWKAWALARLGEQAAAETIFAELVERKDPSMTFNISTGGLAGLALALGKPDAALAELRALTGDSRARSAWITRAVLELNPCFDPLRSDPRFEDLVASMPAPVAATGVMTPPPDSKSVVVLPFANLSGDPEQEYFSDGLTEEILNALARERDLRVPGRASAFSFKGKNASATEIAKALNVAQLVEGSVRKSGNKVRISVQLTRASDGFSEALPMVERELKDIFALQDEVARLVVEKLTRRSAATAPVAVVTNVPEAYDAYLRGRALMTRTTGSGVDAADFFERAVALDPKFALAWTGLADARLRTFANGRDRSPEPVAKARVALDRALELQPALPAALITRAEIHRKAEYDFAAARKDLDRAAALQAPTAELRQAQAYLARDTGDWAEAFRLGREAKNLDPNNAAFMMGNALSNYAPRGDFAEADRLWSMAPSIQGAEESLSFALRVWLRVSWRGPESALRLLERAPAGQAGTEFVRAGLLVMLGRLDEARKVVDALTKPNGEIDAGEPVGRSSSLELALLIATGREESARRLAGIYRTDTQRELARGNRTPLMRSRYIAAEIVLGNHEAARRELELWRREIAQIPSVFARFWEFRSAPLLYAWLGDAHNAVAVLQEGMANGFQPDVSLRYEPEFAAIRQDPRFQELIRRQEAWAKAQPDPIGP